MPFITQGKTNIKYILIVVILAAIAGGGVLAYQYWWATKQESKLMEFPEIKFPKKAVCDWRPDIAKYGQCEKMLGYYYDGERCQPLSGCDLKGDKVPFLSIEECKKQCEKEETADSEIGCADSDARCKGKPNGTKCTTGIWCDEAGEICGGQSCVGLSIGRCSEEKCLSLTNEEFCGSSTYGNCVSDSDCMGGGCSGQVCQSKNEEGVITTCEYRDCYAAKDYGLECKCADNKCQWSK